MTAPSPTPEWRQPPATPTGRRESPLPARRGAGARAVVAVAAIVGITLLGVAGMGFLGMHRSAAAPVASEASRSRPPLGLDPAQTQRTGEWSPICGATHEPLIDFSPVDRGQGRYKVVLTAHNCSAEPATIGTPELWLGGRYGMTPFLRLDIGRTKLTPLTLAPHASAQAVLTWETDGYASDTSPHTLSIHLPGIGDGELRNDLSLTDTSRVWLTGWLPS